MSDAAARAAEALGAPEEIVRRSAEARAKAAGVDVEQILEAWAGGQPTASPAAPPAAAPEPTAPAPEPTAPAPEPTAPAAEPTAPVPAETAVPAEVPAAAAVAAATTTTVPPPPPERVNPRQAINYPVVVSVPTAGIKERTSSGVPRWLAMLFLVIPVFGLLYLAGHTASGCTSGGVVLGVDRASGLPTNCDGTPFKGRGTGGGGTNFIAIGDNVFHNVANCANCHGANGEGGVGPALGGVLQTFASCADHEKWVTGGSAGWPGSTYGDLAKPKKGGMPAFGDALTEEQLKSVVSYERVRFGGGDLQTVLADCGLVTPASSTVPGGSGAGETTTTTAGATAQASAES